MNQPEGRGNSAGRRRRRRDHRSAAPRPQIRPTSPCWSGESGPKICRKCSGRMYPADWIWQQYGLCLGWRCSQCKEKVLARSLPFKGLRKRKPDPDEIRDRAESASRAIGTREHRWATGAKPKTDGGRQKEDTGRRGTVRRD